MRDEIQILLIEDDDIDERIIRRTFHRRRIANPIVRVRDGLEALERLRGTETEPPLERPYLILVDLKMPRMGGLEFLEALRKDPNLHDSIVFVLTTSNDESDKLAAYAQHVAGYLIKSDAGEAFRRHVQMLDHFLLSVQFPPVSL